MTLFSPHYLLFPFRKYCSIFEISWSNSFVYRLNFVMWRVRSVLQLLTIYFLWLAIFKKGGTVFGYDRQLIITYILGTSILRSFVLGSRSIDVATEIANGNLNNYLVKPINYFGNWLTRDLADKALNLIFVIGEVILFIWLLKPTLALQSNPSHVFAFIIASILAMLIHFFLSFLISSVTFWYVEESGWPLRFLSSVIIEFLSGGLFPLDILPQAAFSVFRLLPPAYFLFYPMQIYLGRLTPQALIQVLGMMLFWVVILYKIAQFVWNQGLKVYGAYGR